MRLILARRIERAERVEALANLGLELADIRDEPGQALAEVWMPIDLDDETVIHYVDDIPIGIRYLVINGSEAWAQRVSQMFPVMSAEEVLDRARSARTDAERIEATFQLALTAPREAQEPYFAEMKASLLHRSHDVRHAAILAAGYTTWPELEEILVQLRNQDDSPRVRERAKLLLEEVAVHGWIE